MRLAGVVGLRVSARGREKATAETRVRVNFRPGGLGGEKTNMSLEFGGNASEILSQDTRRTEDARVISSSQSEGYWLAQAVNSSGC